ncbi:glycosyltransferase family 2 protein [Adlercreutzia faecimuris]|uniref:Glycosyltransferase n=1 Tax=Adlercreutzia faecimuris TaxID=2897341 RepID=A0ABS9WFX9_9ACTN|nr:glycosyltransferase [Adlercreutzia sp. JBNU-10]
MSKPVVSIIVPVFNVKDYVRRCLDSLRGQTLSDIEVICVDDGSSDGSSDILDEYAASDGRFAVIHKANAGVAAARNDGMAAARGEFVMFVDSDDYITHDACARLVEAAARENAQIVVFGGKSFPSSFWADRCFAKNDRVYRGDAVTALFFEAGSHPLMCNKMYRRSLLVEGGLRFNEELILGEDNAFQFSVFPRADVVAFVPAPFYFYRMREDSAMGTTAEDHNRRMWLHLDLVKHVWGLWSREGWAARWKTDLVSWGVPLLYDEAEQVCFDERERLAPLFRRELEAVLGDTDLADVDLDPRIGRQVSFLLDAESARSDDPLVTVLVEGGGGVGKATLTSILGQTMQRIEVFVLSDGGQIPSWAEGLARSDQRIRPVASCDMASVLSEARGRYVIGVSSAVSYEPRAFELLLGCAAVLDDPAAPKDGRSRPTPDPDVVAGADSAGLLHACDPFCRFEPDPEVGIEEKAVFSAEELRGAAILSCSAAPFNKLIRIDLARECAGTLQSCAGYQAVALLAILRSQRLMQTMIPFVTVLPMRLDADAAFRLVDQVSSGACAVVRPNAGADGDLLQDDACRAVVRYLMLVTGLVFGDASRRAAYEAARGFCLAGACASLDGEEGRWARLLSEEDYQALDEEHGADLLETVLSTNQRNLLQVGDEAAEVALLNRRLDHFNSSVSFRVGRAVTCMPRKAVAFLKERRARHR